MKIFVGLWIVLIAWWGISLVASEDPMPVMAERSIEAPAPSIAGGDRSYSYDMADDDDDMVMKDDDDSPATIVDSYRIDWLDAILYYVKEIVTAVVFIGNAVFLLRRRGKA